MHRRFQTDFGDTGMVTDSSGKVITDGHMEPYAARYSFIGCTWGITVWARSWEDAQEHCRKHNLVLDGKIESIH